MSARSGVRMMGAGGFAAAIAAWIVFTAAGDWFVLWGLMVGMAAGVLLGAGFSVYIDATTPDEDTEPEPIDNVVRLHRGCPVCLMVHSGYHCPPPSGEIPVVKYANFT